MNVQFSFCGLEKAFGYEIVLRGIEQCFFFRRSARCPVLKFNQGRTRFEDFQGTLLLHGQENYVFKWQFMYV